jgi:hypothetical protein
MIESRHSPGTSGWYDDLEESLIRRGVVATDGVLAREAVRRTRKSGQGRAKLSYGWQVRERVG